MKQVIVKKVCSVCGKLVDKRVVTMNSEKNEIVSHTYCKKHYDEAIAQIRGLK